VRHGALIALPKTMENSLPILWRQFVPHGQGREAGKERCLFCTSREEKSRSVEESARV